ncbi:MAG: hypothetical protein QXQ90_06640 [Desulfurococcaceae archaeon]
MDLATLIAMVAGAVASVGVMVVVLVVYRARRAPAPREGYSSFEAARKVKADAYLLAIDIDANTIRWIPLRDMGNYYVFLTPKSGRFLPVERKPLFVGGYPVFVGLKTSSSAVEMSLPVSLSSSLLKLRDRELSRSPSFISSIRRIYEKVLEEPVESETAEGSVAVEVDYTGVFAQYATLIARAFEKTMDAARSYIVSSFEKGEDIEKRVAHAETWGRFLVYLAFAVVIIVIAIIAWNMFR